MKIKILTLILLIPVLGFGQSRQQAYISHIDSLAVYVMEKYGIPASVTLGIAMVETGGGSSYLCRNDNNHFGIKGRPASAKHGSYRSFQSGRHAFDYFGQMIARKKFYPGLKADMDPQKWVDALKAAGYAVSNRWKSDVMTTITRYNLTRYDKTGCAD